MANVRVKRLTSNLLQSAERVRGSPKSPSSLFELAAPHRSAVLAPLGAVRDVSERAEISTWDMAPR
jgi:hypothetical protein